MPENEAFFVRGDDGAEYGPVDLTEMRQWVREDRVGLGTTVRLDIPGELWQPWQYHSQLVALLAEARATGPMGQGPLPVLAPQGRRFLAGIMDLILSFIMVSPLLMVMSQWLPDELWLHYAQYYESVIHGVVPTAPPPPFPPWFQMIYNLISLGGPILYYAGFHATHGRTPAKSVMRLKVVDAQGEKPPILKAILRSLVFVISVFVFFGAPLIYIFLNPQRRALHDLVAGTYVVER